MKFYLKRGQECPVRVSDQETDAVKNRGRESAYGPDKGIWSAFRPSDGGNPCGHPGRFAGF